VLIKSCSEGRIGAAGSWHPHPRCRMLSLLYFALNLLYFALVLDIQKFLQPRPRGCQAYNGGRGCKILALAGRRQQSLRLAAAVLHSRPQFTLAEFLQPRVTVFTLFMFFFS
jgi:hypothetical protein